MLNRDQFGDHHNPACPDYSSHYENAAERVFPGKNVLSPEEDERVRQEADHEYRHCEGH